MLDVESPPCSHERENVESNIHVVEALAAQSDLGALHDAKLLRAIDRLERVSQVILAAGFHFDEDDEASTPDNQIDLAVAKHDVARENGEPAQTIEPGCPALPGASEGRTIRIRCWHGAI